jgi:hypothetical protein
VKKLIFVISALILVSVGCDKISPVYPDEPVVDYQGFNLYISVDQLGNKTLVGQMSFRFTDGDGNLGLHPLPDSSGMNMPDTLKYNLFLQLYDQKGNTFEKVPVAQGGILKYRIPYMEKEPLSGILDLELTYPVITYDTIFYTFYIYDRDFNRSNTDTTEVIILSGINLD